MGYIEWKEWDHVVAFTTDRKDGFSKGKFASFNQAYQVGEDPDVVLKNREKLCRDHGLEMDHLVTVFQQHTDEIRKVTLKDGGAGAHSFESGIGPCDALYTFEKGLALGIFHADCVPAFLYAPKYGLVGIVHAGQKGTLKKILYKSISYLVREEHIDPQDLYVHFGPALSFQHCILEEDPKAFIQRQGEEFAMGVKATNGIVFLDVPLLNRLQAIEAGVPASHITMSELCTYENEDLLYSFSRDH